MDQFFAKILELVKFWIFERKKTEIQQIAILSMSKEKNDWITFSKLFDRWKFQKKWRPMRNGIDEEKNTNEKLESWSQNRQIWCKNE